MGPGMPAGRKCNVWSRDGPANGAVGMPNRRRGDPPEKSVPAKSSPKRASPKKASPEKASPESSGKKAPGATRAALVATPPQFTEVNVIGTRPISDNSESREGADVDLFLLHTTEAGGGEDLIAFMEMAGDRSYHYIVDDDAHGNTVYDLVDTDLAAWSAKGANHRSINLAFGYSTAAWTREAWIANARNAIRIAAWLAVQDCRKYGIPVVVNSPPYRETAGISDHNFATVMLPQTGNTHTDVGPNFPWDLFAADVASFAS